MSSTPHPDSPLCTSLVLHEDEGVRVSRYTLAPGETTGVHTHAFDYVVVPLQSGTVTVYSESGSAVFSMKKGAPYSRNGGTTHQLTNESQDVIDFVEIEFLV